MASTRVVSVREAFYGIQGEGSRTGVPTVFLRLAGCNLACAFCDTDWRHGEKMSITDAVMLVDKVSGDVRPEYVCLTGGEPCVSPGFDELVGSLRMAGHVVTVETNGTMWREGLRYCHVTVSPKDRWEGEAAEVTTSLLYLDDDRRDYDRDLKLLIDGHEPEAYVDGVLETLPFKPTAVFLQPIYEVRAAWQRAYDLVRARPEWRLSLQTQKWIGCR